MDSLEANALQVHKALQQPDLIIGIPKTILVLLICFTILLIYLFSFWFVLSGVILYVPCYFLSKEDPQMLVMALDSLFQIEYLEG